MAFHRVMKLLLTQIQFMSMKLMKKNTTKFPWNGKAVSFFQTFSTNKTLPLTLYTMFFTSVNQLGSPGVKTWFLHILTLPKRCFGHPITFKASSFCLVWECWLFPSCKQCCILLASEAHGASQYEQFSRNFFCWVTIESIAFYNCHLENCNNNVLWLPLQRVPCFFCRKMKWTFRRSKNSLTFKKE